VPLFGAHHGYFDKTLGCAENKAVIEQINTVKPNILIGGAVFGDVTLSAIPSSCGG
jgi:UDP-N-acetyl-D-mannosaminuronic acid transferase (WecB/TagA/CpsF family)